MFAVLYRFDVKEAREDEFIAAWTTVTEALRVVAGTYGSCLHRTPDGTFVAYARWPSREAWSGDYDLPPSATEARQSMRDCCSSIATMHELDVLVDRLVVIEAQERSFELG